MDNLFEARLLAGLVENVDLRNKDGFTSANLFKEMAVLSQGMLNKLQTGLQWVKNHNIKCIIVGGTAVVHYVSGARDLTPDVDLMVEDLNYLTTQLRSEHLAFAPLPETQVTRHGGGNIGVQVQEFDIDFLNVRAGNVALNNYAMQTAIPGQVGGGTFPIIAPEVLTIMKFDMGRDKDDNDAFLLLKSGHVRRDAYLRAVKVLGRHLQDPESLQMYADMIH